jgi:hypothetical protein
MPSSSSVSAGLKRTTRTPTGKLCARLEIDFNQGFPGGFRMLTKLMEAVFMTNPICALHDEGPAYGAFG